MPTKPRDLPVPWDLDRVQRLVEEAEVFNTRDGALGTLLLALNGVADELTEDVQLEYPEASADEVERLVRLGMLSVVAYVADWFERDRDSRMAELRADNYTWQQIGDATGMSMQTARSRVQIYERRQEERRERERRRAELLAARGEA